MIDTEKSSHKYSAAVIGLGRIGMLMEEDPRRTKPATHAGAFYNHPGIQHLLLCDIDSEKINKGCSMFPNASLFSNYADMLSQKTPDIVAVATHPAYHKEQVRACAYAGVKVIICEKPIANTEEDALSMIETCEKAGATLIIDHPRRFLPLLCDWKDRIKNGELGDIHQISCYYTAGINNSGTHMFDLLRYLFGEIEGVAGIYNYKVSSPDGDDSIDGFLFFENGIRASVHSLEVKDYAIFDMDVYGSLGNIKITDFGISVHRRGVKECSMFTGYKELCGHLDSSTDSRSMWHHLADWAVACVDHPGRQSPSTGMDGLAALRVILAMRRSADNTGQLTYIHKGF